jgi:hypothetical protein
MSMVDSLIAGDTIDFTDVVADYPATAAWVLKYRLVPRFTTPVQAPVELTATTVNTTDYRVQATPTATAAWTPGAYNWFRWVEKAGERQSLGSGSLTVQVNPATVAQGADIRSQAEAALDAINAVLANRATVDQQEMSIAGRSLKRMTVDELLKLRGYYKAQVNAELGVSRRYVVGYR